MTVIVCQECGSDKVQIQSWINPNTEEVKGDISPDLSDEENNWCEVCEKHTVLIVRYFYGSLREWA